jgi:hypothetical protein
MVTHDLDTLFALSSRGRAGREKVLVTGTPQEVAVFHPFIAQFFQGERGRRAMAPAPSGPQREVNDGKQVPCHGRRPVRAGGGLPAGGWPCG